MPRGVTAAAAFVVAWTVVGTAQPGAPIPAVPRPPGVVPPPGPSFPPSFPPLDQARRTGAARLRGRVVAADSGQPLRRATVRATAADIREMVSTLTDADGVYEIRDLPAGRYTVTASKGSYVTLSYGQGRPFESGRPIALADGQAIDRVDIRLPRGGVMTGVVLDEFGEPVPDAVVSPLRSQFVQGRRRLVQAGRGAGTNDIGSFRLFGLPPGSYYLSVTVGQQMISMVPERTDERVGYAPTYYPGASDVGAAQRVTVAAGQTIADLTISLVPARVAQVSGRVIDVRGEPATAGMVMAMTRASPVMAAPRAGAIRGDGTFSINGVPPGEYVLRATVPSTGASVATQAVATVSVDGQDVTGVELVPPPRVVLAGRVTLDGGSVTALQGSQIRVQVLPESDSDLGFVPAAPPAIVRDDLSFETSVSSGRVHVRVLEEGRWALRAVRHQGADVTDRGLDLHTDVRDLEVELTSARQELSGQVTLPDGQAAANYTVVVFAQDRERWSGPSRYIAVGRPDQEGRFRIRTLPPADYYAVAVDALEPGSWMDPDFLDSVVNGAATVALGPGETRTLDLRLVPPR